MSEPERKPSPSTQQFRSHAVHTTLQKWQDKLTNERPDNFRALDDNSRNAYVRLRWILRVLRSKLEKLNPMLSQTNVLKGINKQVANLITPWNQYRSNPAQPQNWQALDNHTNSLIDHVRNLPPGDEGIVWRESLEDLSSEMNAVIKESQEGVQKLQATADDTGKKFKQGEEKLAALEAEIHTQKARLDQMLTQHSTAFTKSEQDRGNQFTATEQDRASKFTEASTKIAKAEQDRTSKFAESQSEKNTEHTTLIKEFEETKTEVIKKHKEELANIAAEGNQKAGARRWEFIICT